MSSGKTESRVKIKKPQTAYFHFLIERRSACSKENPGLSLGQQQKILSKEWKEMLDDSKEKYFTAAANDKARYQQEVAEEAAIRAEKGDDGDDQEGDLGFIHPTEMVFPLARVKKIIKMDPDVKNMSKEACMMISKSTEMFIAMLGGETMQVTEAHKRRTIKEQDVCACIHENNLFEWLWDDFKRVETKLKPNPNSSKQKVFGSTSDKTMQGKLEFASKPLKEETRAVQNQTNQQTEATAIKQPAEHDTRSEPTVSAESKEVEAESDVQMAESQEERNSSEVVLPDEQSHDIRKLKVVDPLQKKAPPTDAGQVSMGDEEQNSATLEQTEVMETNMGQTNKEQVNTLSPSEEMLH